MKLRYLLVGFFGVMLALAYLCYSPLWKVRPKNGQKVILYPPLASSKMLTFVSDPWAPYAGQAGSPLEGYIVDLLRKIYVPRGYEVRFLNMPWSRCIRDTRDGVVTGLAGADFHEVPDFVFPQETVGATEPTFFVRSGSSWKFEGFQSLEKVSLGVIQDYTYSRKLDEYILRHKGTKRIFSVTGENPLDRLLEALETGRAAVFVENRAVVLQKLRDLKRPLTALPEAGTPGAGVRLYVPFSPKLAHSRELAKIFDQRLAELRASGDLERILAPYGLKDWLPMVREIEKLEGALPPRPDP